jgi:hypothetical protein
MNRTRRISRSKPKKSPSPRCTLLCRGTTDAFAVENPRTVILEKWQPSVSSKLTAAGGAIQQRAEDITSYWWDSEGD